LAFSGSRQDSTLGCLIHPRRQPQLRTDARSSIIPAGWFSSCFGLLPPRQTSDVSAIFSPTPHFLSTRVVRLGFIIGFIALIGVLLSGLAAYRVHDQELTLDRIAMARAIDVHASLVQDRLTERELLARVASGLFRAPSVIKANMLQPLRSSIYAFKTDFVVASWIARIKPSELDAARAELARAGFPNPRIRSFDDHPLEKKSLDKPVDVLMDVEPRNPETMAFPGRSL